MQPNPRTMADTFRAVADLLDAHPDLPRPYVSVYDHLPEQADLAWYLHINERATDEADQKAQAAHIIRMLGGHWSKEIYDWSEDARFSQSRDGLNFKVVVTRSAVCERVVVGEETVTIPAKPAEPARVETWEKVEWRCEPLLAGTYSGEEQ